MLNNFKKKLNLIADLFLRLQAPKHVIRSMSRKFRFSGPSKKQDDKWAQTLLEFEKQHLYHIYWSMWRHLSCKKSLLVICKILRLFLNTLKADDKYSLLIRDNLMQPIQMQLSQNQKTFCWFFYAIFESSLNFEHFQKKDDPYSWCISEATYSETRGYINVRKVPFQSTLRKQGR